MLHALVKAWAEESRVAFPMKIGTVDATRMKNARVAFPMKIGTVDATRMKNARVAELVDALVSKTNNRKVVRVRFPSRVLNVKSPQIK